MTYVKIKCVTSVSCFGVMTDRDFYTLQTTQLYPLLLLPVIEKSNIGISEVYYRY